MCGIVGAIADRDVVPVLIEGLKRLEYRGYDSAGIAVLDGAPTCAACAAPAASPRWRAPRRPRTSSASSASATPAGPRTAASPRPTRTRTSATACALVHNGIIENHEEQRERLRALGYEFESQTDTEVIAHLIHHYLSRATTCSRALQRAVRELHRRLRAGRGQPREPDRLVAARMGCPLLVGLGEGENFVASDVSAIIQATRRVIFLEEGDTAEVTPRRRARVRRRRQAGRSATCTSPTCRWPRWSWARTATSCRRKSTSSRARSPTRIEAVIDDGAFSPELFGAERRSGAAPTSRACRSSPAAPAITPA